MEDIPILRRLLADQGVHLSLQQVERLINETPQRLNVEVLLALCEIFKCTPNDLISIAKGADDERTRPAALLRILE